MVSKNLLAQQLIIRLIEVILAFERGDSNGVRSIPNSAEQIYLLVAGNQIRYYTSLCVRLNTIHYKNSDRGA